MIRTIPAYGYPITRGFPIIHYLNKTLLAALRAKGIYLYPCVANTTAVTQETDQLFGLFKTAFRQNLNQITDDRLAMNKNATYTPRLIGLLVFGGKDPVTKICGYKDAFAIGFSKECNLSAWASVGAAPLTRRCLKNEMIAHTEGDPMHTVYKNIEAANHSACNLLSARGYNGIKLKVSLKEGFHAQASTAAVTVPNSKERLDAIAKARFQGEKFFMTMGGHAATDEMFKGKLLKWKRQERALVLKG